jgi:pilus assembly protein Flp/PilA
MDFPVLGRRSLKTFGGHLFSFPNASKNAFNSAFQFFEMHKREDLVRRISNLLLAVYSDENGGEVLEYALVAGLIVVAAIVVISAVGGKVLANWTSLNSSM